MNGRSRVKPRFSYFLHNLPGRLLALGCGAALGLAAQAGTLQLANDYLTGLDTDATNTVEVARNFAAILDGPLTGSDTLTLKGGYISTASSMLSLINGAGNTFSGNIVVDVDGGTLQLAGNLYAAPGTPQQGLVLPDMTADNTITVRRGATFRIEDNALGGIAGYAENRLGTPGNRPSITLAGGTLYYNGANNAAAGIQTLGDLNLVSGGSALTLVRNTAGTPQLVFRDLVPAKGSYLTLTATSLGTAAANVPLLWFTNALTVVGGGGAAGSKTMSIVPRMRLGSDLVYYGANGVRALVAAEYQATTGANDVNAVDSAANVKMTGTTTTTTPLSADKTLNSLVMTAGANLTWAMGKTLTLTSGQLLSTPNNTRNISSGVLTAGAGADTDLDVTVLNNTTTIGANIADNGSGKITLVKNGGGGLTLATATDNSYSGGTFVNEGTLTTGATGNRRYLGTGPVRVDNAYLTLGATGATSYAETDQAGYTAVNGGQIAVANVSFTSPSDRFYIDAGSILSGNATTTAGKGLNSITRVAGLTGIAGGQAVLEAGATVAFGGTLTTGLGTGVLTLASSAGTDADLYFGLAANSVAASRITVGTGTPWRGISTDRSARNFLSGTITANGDFDLRGFARPGVAPVALNMGSSGAIAINTPNGDVTVNILGAVTWTTAATALGSDNHNLVFRVKPGATFTLTPANALGASAGSTAAVVVERGGTLAVGNSAALNGAVTVEAGGRLIANQAGGLTGTGALTFEPGSILDITAATGFSGAQAAGAAIQPGVIVRLSVNIFGSGTEALDTYLGAKAPVYEIYGANRGAAMPVSSGTAVMTLSRGTNGLGGMLVNDLASRSLTTAANGKIVIGPNGGVMAATTNTTLTVAQDIEFGTNELVIGSAEPFDGFPARNGTVTLSAPAGYSTAEAGSRIRVITNAILINAADAIPDETDIVVDGAFSLGAKEGIGSLSGGGRVILGGYNLTLGSSGKSTSFSGDFALGGTIVKTGNGRFDIVSSVTNHGAYSVNGGTLAFSGNGRQLATTAYTLYDGGTLLLDNSEINDPDRLAGPTPGITFQGGTFQFIGKDGEASGEELGQATFSGGASEMDVVNGAGEGSSSEIRFSASSASGGTINFKASNGTLGAPGDNPRVYFTTGMPQDAVVPYATVGHLPAYYDGTYGIRAYTLDDVTEFNGTIDQTTLDTVYTVNNNHLPLTAFRTVKSLWIDSPGEGYAVDLGNEGTYSLIASSGGINLTGDDDFEFVRGVGSNGGLKQGGNQALYIGVAEPGVTLRMGVPIVNGTGGLYKHGAGTLELDELSDFTGAMGVSDGLVKYGANGDLAAVALTIWGDGGFDFAGRTDTLKAVTVYSGFLTNSADGGELTITTLTLGGGPTGSVARVDTGTGTLKLGGNVTYDNSNNPDTAVLDGNVNLNGATRTFTVNNSLAPGADIDLDVPAVIAATAGYGITKGNAGVMRLSGNNTFDGALTINNSGGSLILAHPNAAGIPSVTRTFSVGSGSSLVLDGSAGDITIPANYSTLSLNGAGDALLGPVSGALVNWVGINSVPSAITLAANTSLASLSGRLTLAGNITGGYALTKNGSGTLALAGSGANTFTKLTTVNGGKLELLKADGANAVNAIANGGLTINNGGAVEYAASSANPDMMGTGAVTIKGSGYLDFNGATDSIGAVTVNATDAVGDTTNICNTAGLGGLSMGALSITPQSGYLTTIDPGTGTLTLGGNVTFTANLDGRAKISGNLDLGGANRTFTVADGTHPSDLHVDAKVSGAYGITKATAGSKLILSGANEYTGITYLNAGILRAQDNPKALGASEATNALQLNSSTYMELAGDTGVDFGRNTWLIGAQNTSATVTSDRSTPGEGVTHSLGSLIIGRRTLFVAAGTNVSSGVAGVKFGAVALTNYVYFAVTNTAPGATTLLELGDITNGANITYFRGDGDARINGNLGSGPVKSGHLNKYEAGTLTLAGANEYAGYTLINGGRIVLSHELAAQYSTVSNNAAGGLAFGEGTAFTLGALAGSGSIALSNAAGAGVTLTIGNNNHPSTSFSGQFSGPGGVKKVGTGTQILANVTPAQYEGNTEVLDGVLRVNTNFLSATGDIILAAPGKLYLNFNATNAVRYLSVDGIKYFGGLYSSNNLPEHITGPGVLLTQDPPELLCRIQVDRKQAATNEFFVFSPSFVGDNTNIIAYAWDFDDNGSIESHAAIASNQYATSGVYQVRLIVTNEIRETATYLWTGFLFVNPPNMKMWSGEGADELASNPGNWWNGVAPVAGDDIVLNETSSKNITWDLDIPLASWWQDGYNGTVTIMTEAPPGAFDVLEIAGDCVLKSGTWTHMANPAGTFYEVYRLQVAIGSNLVVATNASIDVMSKGYAKGGCGPGRYSDTGSYGGRGDGGGASAWCYGSIVAPTNLGDGGYSLGGGGAILLTVAGETQLYGLLRANGHPGWWYYTGAGGTVNLRTGTLVGNGNIQANASRSGGLSYGGGGGGRIALTVTNAGADFSMYTGTYTCIGDAKGAGGTIYLRTADQGLHEGTLIIDNNWKNPVNATEISAYVSDTEVGNVIIQNYGYLSVLPGQALTVRDAWSNSSTSKVGSVGGKLILGGAPGSTTTVYGSSTFQTGLTCTNLGGQTILFEAGKTNTVPAFSPLALQGEPAASNLFLRSTVEGAPWFLKLDTAADQTIQYVDVKDSDASSGAPAIGIRSRDSGGNANWVFMTPVPGEKNTWNGNAGTAWVAGANWSLGRAPLAEDDVLIPDGCANYPILSSDLRMDRIEIESGASLSLGGRNLTVATNAIVAGAIIPTDKEKITFLGDVDFTGGSFTTVRATVAFAGDGAQTVNLAGLTFYTIAVEKDEGAVAFTAGFQTRRLRCEAATGALNLTFQPGSTITTRDLVLLGSVTTTNIMLRSASPGDPWYLTASGYRFVQGVDVQDSDASGGFTIAAASSSDSGRNTNWEFGESVKYAVWLGTIDSNFHLADNWLPAVVPDATTRVIVQVANRMTVTNAVAVKDLVVGGESDAASVTVGAELTVGENIIVLENGVLALDMPTVVNNNVIVGESGQLTHSGPQATETNRLNVTIYGDMEVEVGGVVSATGKGYQGGRGPGSGGGGACHGGQGHPITSHGERGQCYGSVIAPTNLGSGGDWFYSSGPGGGAIQLKVSGTLLLNGTMVANGNNGSQGAASGGSIWLTAGSLIGNGPIEAIGGPIWQQYGNGAGGGGRIALVLTGPAADFSTFTGSVTARGGATANWSAGCAGTIYRELAGDVPGKGELIVNNAGGWSGYAEAHNTDLNGMEAVTNEFRRIVLTNGASLNIGADDTLIITDTEIVGEESRPLTNGIFVSGGTLITPPEFAFSNFFITISGTGATFNPATSLTIPTNAEFRIDQPHVMTTDIIVGEGGKLSHTANGSSETRRMDLTLQGDLTVQNGGGVDVSGRGYSASYGPGTHSANYCGASHGGLGVGGLSCYGSLVAPTNIGSGGRDGGRGGGAIRLAVSGVINNDGGIRANASAATQRAGAGGSIFITCGELLGSGPIQANSSTNVTGGYPGGGGRIALAVTNAGADFSAYTPDMITVYGGTDSTGDSGGVGTLYLRWPGQGLYDGALFVDDVNENTVGTEIGPLVTDTQVSDVFIRQFGRLALTNQTLTVSGIWSNGASFTGLADSMVAFAGAPESTSTLYGSTLFNGLGCYSAGKTLLVEADATNAVAAGGRLWLKGTEASPVRLRSTEDGTAWKLNVDPTADGSVQCVDVKDSDASGGAEILALNSVNSGNNQNWNFLTVPSGETITWTGGGSTVWSARENWDRNRAPVETDVIVIPGSLARYPELDYDRTVNHLSIQSGASLGLAGRRLTVTNDLVVAGSLVTSGDGTLTVSGTTVFPGGTLCATDEAMCTFHGNVDFAGGSVTATYSTIVFGKDVDFAGGSVTAPNSTIVFGKDVNFIGGSFTGDGATVQIAGSGDQTVNLAGFTFHKIAVLNNTGAVTFGSGFEARELRCEAAEGAPRLAFQPGVTVTVRDLVLLGSATVPNIALRSSQPGDKWNLAVSGYRSVRGVDVQDSDARAGLPIPAAASQDSGNNNNWVFDATWASWLGTSDSSFDNPANWSPAEVPGAGARVRIDNMHPLVATGAVSIVDLIVGGGSETAYATFHAPVTVAETIMVLSNGVLALDAPSVVSNNLFVMGGGQMTHSGNTTNEQNKLDVTILGSVEVETGGIIDVTDKGYGCLCGPGSSLGTQDDWGGGSHGGRGYCGDYYVVVKGPCYGSITAPTNLGSGGYGQNGEYARGVYGKGGGAIRLSVSGVIRHDGLMAADGGHISDRYPGAGGSIFLTAGDLIGTGDIHANGGRFTYWASWQSGAGGGRVSLVLTNPSADFARFTGPVAAFSSVHGSVHPGGDPGGGGAGTVYRQAGSDLPGHGTVTVANNNYVSYYGGPSNTEVPLGAGYGVPGEAEWLAFHVADGARLQLTADLTVGDIYLDSTNASLDMGSNTLTVRHMRHTLELDAVINRGEINWLQPGTLILIR